MKKPLAIIVAAALVGPVAFVAAALSSTIAPPVALAEDNGVGATPMMGWSHDGLVVMGPLWR